MTVRFRPPPRQRPRHGHVDFLVACLCWIDVLESLLVFFVIIIVVDDRSRCRIVRRDRTRTFGRVKVRRGSPLRSRRLCRSSRPEFVGSRPMSAPSSRFRRQRRSIRIRSRLHPACNRTPTLTRRRKRRLPNCIQNWKNCCIIANPNSSTSFARVCSRSNPKPERNETPRSTRIARIKSRPNC
jgi:hypothetical protein